jgi:hypothetical protein
MRHKASKFWHTKTRRNRALLAGWGAHCDWSGEGKIRVARRMSIGVPPKPIARADEVIGLAEVRDTVLQGLLQHQGEEAARHMTADCLIELVEDRTRLEEALRCAEDLLHHGQSERPSPNDPVEPTGQGKFSKENPARSIAGEAQGRQGGNVYQKPNSSSNASAAITTLIINASAE